VSAVNIRTKENIKMKKEMTITTYPCFEDESLRAECLENSKHVDIKSYRPHSCGAKFSKVVEVVEVEPKKFEFVTKEQMKTLTKPERRKAKKINNALFIHIDTGERIKGTNNRLYYTRLKARYSHKDVKVFQTV
jgi:hypothetical protein